MSEESIYINLLDFSTECRIRAIQGQLDSTSGYYQIRKICILQTIIFSREVKKSPNPRASKALYTCFFAILGYLPDKYSIYFFCNLR